MGYFLVKHLEDSVDYNRKQFYMDNDLPEDLPLITDDIASGSEAIVIATGKRYILGETRTWQPEGTTTPVPPTP